MELPVDDPHGIDSPHDPGFAGDLIHQREGRLLMGNGQADAVESRRWEMAQCVR